MDEKRHAFLTKVWLFLYWLLHRPVASLFCLDYDEIRAEGPCIVISNHVTAWDPIHLALSFPHTKLYYVASEHIFRWGLFSRFLIWIMEPIARKKATMGMDTVMQCLRHLKAGHTVVLYAEGNTTWNGITDDIFPATGKLVRTSGASLITYRTEGGYLTLPRWGKGIRRGKMRGRQVGFYSPEQLRTMQPSEINELISRDIYENVWERQKKDPKAYVGKSSAEQIERLLCLCPRCRRIGRLQGKGNRVFCDCGFETTYTPYGSFDPPEPFENIAQWDSWQLALLRSGKYEHGESLFADEPVHLAQIREQHRTRDLGYGKLSIREKTLICGPHRFPLAKIDNMSLVETNVLLFSIEGSYYEIKKPCCLRKYLIVWEEIKKTNKH